MKIIIDIDKYQLEHCKRHVSENYANLLEESIAKGIILTNKNKATNGDMIRALFPNTNPEEDIQEPHYILFTLNGFCFSVSKEWWNAPYKVGDTDESN